jgi:antitoxin MazE
MQVAKWGNSLAIRLPKHLVDELGLKPGDDVELKNFGPNTLGIARNSEREEALARMRDRGLEAPGYVFDRDEGNAR